MKKQIVIEIDDKLYNDIIATKQISNRQMYLIVNAIALGTILTEEERENKSLNTLKEQNKLLNTAKWIYVKFDEETGVTNAYKCSNCGEYKNQINGYYCATCGCKMENFCVS